jgi:hypothetical protein
MNTVNKILAPYIRLYQTTPGTYKKQPLTKNKPLPYFTISKL